MAIPLNDNIQINAGKPSEERYLKPDLTPYAQVAEANAIVVSSRRYLGLTVKIGKAEYWWRDNTTDAGLVLKTESGITKVELAELITDQEFTATEGQTVFGPLSSSIIKILIVTVGGVAATSANYTAIGTMLTLKAGANANEIVRIVFL